MFGIITSEDSTLIELWPVFGSEKGIPSWSQFRVNGSLPDRWWGEYGIAFSSCGKSWRDFTVWLSWGITTYNYDFDRVSIAIKRKLRSNNNDKHQ